MTLRLVLVSLVAAMGLTVPSAPVIESWVASTQNWMNARFADWDTRSAQTTDFVIVNDYYDVGRLTPHLATSSSPTTASSRRTGPTCRSRRPRLPLPSLAVHQDMRSAALRPMSLVSERTSFVPILVGEQLGQDIDYELNLMNEGISLLPPEPVRTPYPTVRLELMPAVREAYREVQVRLTQWSRTLVAAFPSVRFQAYSQRRIVPSVAAEQSCGPVDPWSLLGQGIGINPLFAVAPHPACVRPARPVEVSPTSRALADQKGFESIETCPSLYFAGELVQVKSAEPTKPTGPKQPLATPVAVRPPMSTAVNEVRELPDDLDIEAADELVSQEDGFAAPSPARMAPVVLATPSFEPLEIEGDYYMGTAFELNLHNDGLNIAGRS